MSTQVIFLTWRNRDARTPEDFPEVTENPFPPFLLTGFWQCDYFASYTVLDQTPALSHSGSPTVGKDPGVYVVVTTTEDAKNPVLET